jgi:hypothetical protein
MEEKVHVWQIIKTDLHSFEDKICAIIYCDRPFANYIRHQLTLRRNNKAHFDLCPCEAMPNVGGDYGEE